MGFDKEWKRPGLEVCRDINDEILNSKKLCENKIENLKGNGRNEIEVGTIPINTILVF